MNKKPDRTPEVAERNHCGIIMPIASMPGYDAAHWIRVRNILERGIEAAGYIPRLVSESEEIGVIHGRIVQNLYDDDIVVCDVSGKNANVMFELGMRLAFDKPTIIVKDGETGYSFDTQVIEHINYRQDLRYDDVEEFVEKLAVTITATVAAKKADPNYSPFLSHFSKRIKPRKLETEEVSGLDFVLQKMSELDGRLSHMTRLMEGQGQLVMSEADYMRWASTHDRGTLRIALRAAIQNHIEAILGEARAANSEYNDVMVRDLVQTRIRNSGFQVSPMEFSKAFDEVLNTGKYRVNRTFGTTKQD